MMRKTRKGGDEDQYRMRKRDHDCSNYREEEDHRPRRQPRRNQQGYHQRDKIHQQNSKNIKKKDNFDPQSLRQYVFKKPKESGKIKLQKTIKETKTEQIQTNKAKLYTQEYKPIKEKLDNQMDEYKQKGPLKQSKNHEELKDFQKKPYQDKQIRQQGRHIYHQHRQNYRSSRTDGRQQNRRRNREQKEKQAQNSDESWSLNQNKEEEEGQEQSESWIVQGQDTKNASSRKMNQARQQQSKKDESNWLQNSNRVQDTSNSSFHLHKFGITDSLDDKDDNTVKFSQSLSEKYKDMNGLATNHKKVEEKDENSDSDQIDQNSQLNKAHGQDGFSDLINNQFSIEEEGSFNEEKEKKEQQEQQRLKIEEEVIKQKLLSFQECSFKKVFLKFLAEDNIFEFRVKQIELLPIEATLKIHSNDQVSIKKHPDINKSQIRRYINLKTSGCMFPKIYVNKPEDDPLFVEGQEQGEISHHTSNQFELCQVRVPKEEMKVEDILAIRVVQVRCMECEGKSQMVVTGDNSVLSSCNKCSAKMEGKVSKVYLQKE